MRRDQPSGWPLSTSATIVAAVVLAICAVWSAAAVGDGWLARALRSRVTVVGGVVFLASIVLLYLLAGVLWRTGRGRRRTTGDAGTAAIEFVLVFPIALTIVLVMIQSMLLVTQNIVVHYSAYIAARAAIVQVPRKVSYIEPRNVVAEPDSSEKMAHILKAAIWAVTG